MSRLVSPHLSTPVKQADLSGAPRIISEVGSSNTGEIKALEPPADHKGAATAIIVIFAFIFAVAGVFIGVYFRVERVLKCIDRIGGSNSLDTEALIDDTKSIIGMDAMSTLQKQNETGFVHSCPAEAYPMKKQIYERANKTPHTGKVALESPNINHCSFYSAKINRTRASPSRPVDDCHATSKSKTQRQHVRYDFTGLIQIRIRSLNQINVFGTLTRRQVIWLDVLGKVDGLEIVVNVEKQNQVIYNKLKFFFSNTDSHSMYRRMRQERKKRTEDDDVHSVISEARSQRSMVIDGGSVS